MGTVPLSDQVLTRRVGDLRHKRQCRLCLWHNWVVHLCPHSFSFAPQLSDSFIPVCLATNVSMRCQRVREEGKSCVVDPLAVHIHTLPCLFRSMHSQFRFFAEHSLWAGGPALVLCRVT